jgi:hypothetical protein
MGAMRIAMRFVSALSAAGFGSAAYGGTVITTNLPSNMAIINIDARADGSGIYNGDQSLWYQPFNTSGTLPEYTVPAGIYNFRVISPSDAARLFPALTSQQTNQIYTGWTFNSPWTTDYLVFDSAAATNNAIPQLFDGAFSNTNGGPATWHFYATATDAYNAAISNGFAGLIRTGASGGRDSTNFSAAYTFTSTAKLIFVISDNGLGDNAGGVSVLVSPAVGPVGPLLTIEGVSPNTVRLLWPANNPAFNLQVNTNSATTNWTAASPLPIVLGTNNVVTNTASGGQKFYRLIKP